MFTLNPFLPLSPLNGTSVPNANSACAAPPAASLRASLSKPPLRPLSPIQVVNTSPSPGPGSEPPMEDEKVDAASETSERAEIIAMRISGWLKLRRSRPSSHRSTNQNRTQLRHGTVQAQHVPPAKRRRDSIVKGRQESVRATSALKNKKTGGPPLLDGKGWEKGRPCPQGA